VRGFDLSLLKSFLQIKNGSTRYYFYDNRNYKRFASLVPSNLFAGYGPKHVHSKASSPAAIFQQASGNSWTLKTRRIFIRPSFASCRKYLITRRNEQMKRMVFWISHLGWQQLFLHSTLLCNQILSCSNNFALPMCKLCQFAKAQQCSKLDF